MGVLVCGGGGELPAGVVGDAGVADAAAGDGGVDGGEGFVEGDGGVPGVQLPEVEVVDLEAV